MLASRERYGASPPASALVAYEERVPRRTRLRSMEAEALAVLAEAPTGVQSNPSRECCAAKERPDRRKALCNLRI